MTEGISILDEVRKHKYEASLITTYNAFFPFYEDVLLKHLQSVGCYHNFVVADARQVAASLKAVSACPRRAGKEYSLLPVAMIGAFHPKLIFLIGKERGLLLVGSHNLTISGFSYNREITNRFEVNGGKDAVALAVMQRAWQFVKDWIANLPAAMLALINKTESLADWLRVPSDKIDETPFFGSLPIGPALWQNLRPRLPAKVKRIIVIGPFFDGDLTFLKQLMTDLCAEELIVGVDPNSVLLPEHTRQFLTSTRFVDATGLQNGSGYLHAKAILLTAHDGQEMLITGSANPSRAAWLAAPEFRNAEAVILRDSALDKGNFNSLGLASLAQAREITIDEWQAVAARNNGRVPNVEQTSDRLPLIAITSEDGFELSQTGISEDEIEELIALDNKNNVMASCDFKTSTHGDISVTMQAAEKCGETAFLELRLRNDERIYAIVHHTAELLEAAQSEKQKNLRVVLSSLYTDKPLISELMRIVERVIFDDLPETSIGGESRDQAHLRFGAEAKIQTSFSIDLNETRKFKNSLNQQITSGDLGLLLDALIHRLGVGLYAEVSYGTRIAHSEEELIGLEEEFYGQQVETDKEALLSVCQRKVKKLLRRMAEQLRQVTELPDCALKVICQLSAILGLIYRLCELTTLNVSWLPAGARMVPEKELIVFFFEASQLLYKQSNGVMAVALPKLQDKNCVEISLVRGLLLWLAYECRVNFKKPLGFDTEKQRLENLRGLARLISLSEDLRDDAEAMAWTRDAIANSSRQYNVGWLEEFSQWMRQLCEIGGDASKPAIKQVIPTLGDIVRLNHRPNRLFVVIKDKLATLELLDLDDESKNKIYTRSSVTVVKPAN